MAGSDGSGSWHGWQAGLNLKPMMQTSRAPASLHPSLRVSVAANGRNTRKRDAATFRRPSPDAQIEVFIAANLPRLRAALERCRSVEHPSEPLAALLMDANAVARTGAHDLADVDGTVALVSTQAALGRLAAAAGVGIAEHFARPLPPGMTLVLVFRAGHAAVRVVHVDELGLSLN
jgi:hypothetical protein